MTNQETALHKFLDDLGTRMWRTAGARFNASRRLRVCNRLSAVAIALLSSYILTISIVQMRYAEYLAINADLDKILSLVSTVGSLLIIVVSLTEWAKDFSVRAERIFDNATCLTNLRNRLNLLRASEYSSDIIYKEVDGVYCKSYEELTGEGSPNHEPIDDLLFRSRHYHDLNPGFKMCWMESMTIRLWCHLAPCWFYVTVIVAPPALVAYSIYR